MNGITFPQSVTVMLLELVCDGGGGTTLVASKWLLDDVVCVTGFRFPACGVLNRGLGNVYLSQSGDTVFLEYMFGGVGGFWASLCLIASILSRAALVLSRFLVRCHWLIRSPCWCRMRGHRSSRKALVALREIDRTFCLSRSISPSRFDLSVIL